VYDSEVVEALPTDDHDQLVHAALTPNQLIVLRRSEDD
jgi:5-formyltetrahydrofolate cyclo-ligase